MRSTGRTLLVPLMLGLGLIAGACATVVGSGNVIEKDVSVDDFSRLEVSSAFEVQVATGEAASLTLRIDEKVEPYLDVGVDGDTLRIGLEPVTLIRNVTLEARVVVPALESIAGSGATRLTLTDQVAGDDLTIDLSGASTLEGSTEYETITVTVSGASQLTLAGRAINLVVDGSGASELSLLELQADALDIELSGASDADVAVTDSISAQVSGASSLRYRGTPSFTRQDSSGASSITQLP